jgi:hypothetical protein
MIQPAHVGRELSCDYHDSKMVGLLELRLPSEAWGPVMLHIFVMFHIFDPSVDRAGGQGTNRRRLGDEAVLNRHGPFGLGSAPSRILPLD